MKSKAMVVLLVGCMAGLSLMPREATADTIIIDPVPLPVTYLIETDKAAYELGEQVHVTHRLINQGEEPFVIQFMESPGFDLLVLQEGIEVWPGPTHHFAVIWDWALPAGDSAEFHYAWDMTDLHGDLVAPGTYELLPRMNGGPEPIFLNYEYPPDPRTQITIIPEPGIGALMVLGLAFLAKCRKGERPGRMGLNWLDKLMKQRGSS